MKEPPLAHCPNCNQDTLARIIGSGAGLIFKGSGFYLTDYKSSGDKKETPSSKKPEKKEDKASDTTSPPATETKSKDDKTPPTPPAKKD